MYVLDASVWVAFFTDFDPFHRVSREWITRAISGSVRFVDPVIVLPEIAGPIARLTGDNEKAKRASDFVVHMPLMSLLPVDGQLARMAAELAADLKVKGSDAVYISLAAREALQLVTWDETQLTRGSARVPARRPSELL